nr:MAG TPA_asm: hypothetical protein [Caudoviricetes sp.]DAX12455.1 MAG TPA: hypothetical protein [Caudoviricetes sp.]
MPFCILSGIASRAYPYYLTICHEIDPICSYNCFQEDLLTFIFLFDSSSLRVIFPLTIFHFLNTIN